MVTKAEVDRSLFVVVKDNDSGKLKHVVVPTNFQIGTLAEPKSLSVVGSLSLNALSVSNQDIKVAQGTISISSNDTLVSLTEQPTFSRVAFRLPKSPRVGQVHFIKDSGGFASTTPIDVISSDLIDNEITQSITTNFGVLGVYWSKTTWNVLVAAASSSNSIINSGSFDVSASYLVLSNTGSLTNERQFNPDTSDFTAVDGGADSTYDLALTTTGVTPGTYAAATITVDSKGRLSAASANSLTSSSGGADTDAAYVVIANTSSLPNERALAAGAGIRITDGGANSTVTFAINDNVVATVSGTVFTGVVSASAGLSGSLQQVGPGLSYLVAGTNVTITSQSNGQVVVTSTASGVGSGADVSASYVIVGNTGSLPNERALTAGTGVKVTDAGANSTITLSIDDNVVATVSGTHFTGPVSASSGLSGSLQRVAPNLSYLVGGVNITITSQSNGQVVIAGTATTASLATWKLPATFFSIVENVYTGSGAAPTSELGDFTTGCSFSAQSPQGDPPLKVEGVRFYTALASPGGKIRCSLWSELSGLRVAVTDVNVPGPGQYTASFGTASYNITGSNQYGTAFYATTYVTSGLRYTLGSPPNLLSTPFIMGRRLILNTQGAFAASDAKPSTSTNSEWYPVEPTITQIFTASVT